MAYNKDSLTKLLSLIKEICGDPANDWFKFELLSKLESTQNINSPQIEEIYEYCIQKIIKEQAEKFYLNFELTNIKEILVTDFIRMEKFKRENQFKDFCLAAFQQIEATVNELANKVLQDKFVKEKNIKSHKIKNKLNSIYEPKELWQLVFYPELSEGDLSLKLNKSIGEWDFLEKYKLILYYYYFDEKIYNYYDFQNIYFLGNELYQIRNLNHRGGTPKEKQIATIEKVTSDSYRYYFKFLGFLEDFISTINNNLLKKNYCIIFFNKLLFSCALPPHK